MDDVVEALPVAVLLEPRLAEEVGRWAETVASWQVVELDGPVTPRLVLAADPVPGRPTVVVSERLLDTDEMRAALLAGAVDVIWWPAERERLLELPERVGAPAERIGGPALLRVGGVAGGTGASTVALAVGGLVGWGGRRAVVVGGPGLLRLCGVGEWSGPDAGALARLAAREAAAEVVAVSRALAGVPGALVLSGAADSLSITGWPVDLVVADVGADVGAGIEADVLVARPDGALRAYADRCRPGSVLVINGDGPLAQRGVERVAPGPCVRLPASARVAAAGLDGRVPAGLPGSWLRVLQRGLAGSGQVWR